ncbi:MAG TPA: phenylalanine--tRNA ligase subunit beta [Euzebyales bacterium]|nr:phenylalanine--tRNA ligase subunit beta [Euzebyales bacterium]
MRVPHNWLREFVDPGLDVAELADVMTQGGLIVEAIEYPTGGVRGVRVGEVRDIATVEGSDRLVLVDVFDGDATRWVVCGARNFAVGDRVAAALPGGRVIDARSIMGHTSDGMLASARELGIADDHSGILVLGADAPVGEDLRDWLELDDPVFDIEVTPDRGYLLSILGVAHDVAALTGAKLTIPEATPAPGDDSVPITIADTERCRRFEVRTIAGVRIGPSPVWLQRRLTAAGMRPVSNVVDATNAAMLEIGNPIHAYDLALVAGPELVVRTARAGERLRTLDGVERELDAEDLLICDASGPVALAGVMGGESTEINEATSDVLLEVANFQARTVLRSVRRHQLPTQGSMRWERMVPPESVPLAASRCSDLIVALAGGTVTGGADHYPNPVTHPPIRLRPRRAATYLGVDLDAGQQAELLERIGCETRTDGADLVVVRPPYRPDLTIEVDLYEEIARIHGYDRVPETLPSTGQAGGRAPERNAQLQVRQTLAGAGWHEILTEPFITDDELSALGWEGSDRRLRTIALVNPLSQEAGVLRTSLLPSLLRIARQNANRQVGSAALFEIGRAYLPPTAGEPGADGGPEQVTLPAEPLLLGLVGYGRFEPDRHDHPGRDVDIFDAIGVCQLVARRLGRPALTAEASDELPFHPGRAARLSLPAAADAATSGPAFDTPGPTVLGVVGELHPRVLAALELPPRTVAGEIRLQPLIAGGIVHPRATAPSTLPGLRFDVAVVTDEAVEAHAVEVAVREGAGPDLTDVTLFDVYRGDAVGTGQRSLAYHVALDNAVRQLTDRDEAAAIAGIEASVAARVGGRLRK